MDRLLSVWQRRRPISGREPSRTEPRYPGDNERRPLDRRRPDKPGLGPEHHRNIARARSLTPPEQYPRPKRSESKQCRNGLTEAKYHQMGITRPEKSLDWDVCYQNATPDWEYL